MEAAEPSNRIQILRLYHHVVADKENNPRPRGESYAFTHDGSRPDALLLPAKQPFQKLTASHAVVRRKSV